jgi:predicted DNA-binding mobile mystery protein A
MNKRKIVGRQLDEKLLMFQQAGEVVPPASGWIFAFRYALNMSLRQLGQRLSITPQSVKEIEEREKRGTISVKVLQQVASALNMKFFYGFIPEDGTIEAMIEKRATELAVKIVERTSIHMNLEDQAVSEKRLKKAINEKAREIMYDLPKQLWD